MAKQIIAGKKPLSAKPVSRGFNTDDLFGNTLGVDPAIQKEIDTKGMTARWINASQLEAMSGFHQKGWRPYKCDTISASDSFFGKSPDGYIRRGDCVLAVRPKELHERHKQYLEERASQGKQAQKAQAEELRRFARKAGLDEMQVLEGYDDAKEV